MQVRGHLQLEAAAERGAWRLMTQEF